MAVKVTAKQQTFKTKALTMLQLAQAWSEMYAKKNPDVRVAVSGGGSGTGIAGIINGVVDIANCSRAMKLRRKGKKSHGVEASQFIMGLGVSCLRS